MQLAASAAIRDTGARDIQPCLPAVPNTADTLNSRAAAIMSPPPPPQEWLSQTRTQRSDAGAPRKVTAHNLPNSSADTCAPITQKAPSRQSQSVSGAGSLIAVPTNVEASTSKPKSQSGAVVCVSTNDHAAAQKLLAFLKPSSSQLGALTLSFSINPVLLIESMVYVRIEVQHVYNSVLLCAFA